MSTMTKGALIESLIEVSSDAGRAILEVYQTDFSVQQKEDRTPLTIADTRSHGLILDYLSRNYSYPVLSEEGWNIPYEERRNWKDYWLVDPLDGTKEFVKRQGDFTVNIALIHDRKPVAGVVYVPVTGVAYYAEQGRGAFRLEKGKAEKLPIVPDKQRLTIVGSRSHATPELEQYIQEMQKRYGDVEFLSRGSSLKFCLVAEGQAHLYPRLGPTMEWDTAAGQIVVEEAGGQVLDFSSRTPLLYNKENLHNPSFLVLRGDRYA